MQSLMSKFITGASVFKVYAVIGFIKKKKKFMQCIFAFFSTVTV